MEDKKYIECKNCEDLSCERECERRLDTMCNRVPPKDCVFKKAVVLEQKLEKIKVIAQDIIKNDCYENSNAKAEKILQIIEGEE